MRSNSLQYKEFVPHERRSAATGEAAAQGRDDAGLEQQREELLAGLQAAEPTINSKFFYDSAGSELFARICHLPEYYLTRTEAGILSSNSRAIAATLGTVGSVIEPGAGGCEKIRYLLKDLAPGVYVPMDISADYLERAAQQLRGEFEALRVLPLTADFSRELQLPGTALPGRRLLFYPGSTIGNFTPEQAQWFLRRCAKMLGPGSGLLIGVDLHKDSAILNAAYNDAQGVTAAFNRNILRHANHILDADFEPQNFEHLAFYNKPLHRIEMHLVSSGAQTIQYHGGALSFAAGDSIHTEYSCKYSREDFVQLAAVAGWRNRACWTDSREWFSVQYFEVE